MHYALYMVKPTLQVHSFIWFDMLWLYVAVIRKINNETWGCHYRLICLTFSKRV